MIERETRGSVRVLRLSHGRANAMDLELLHAITAELRELREGAPRAGVLTGAGSIFCAGVDLKRVVAGGAPYVREFLPALEAALEAAFTLPKPLVAAVNGHAIAGGFILMAACDRRLLARGDAKVGLPELHVGVPFPTLVMELLRATVAPPRLQELLLVGGTHSPDAALNAGLVDELIEPDRLLDAACATADRLGSLSPSAYATTKSRLRQPAIEAWRARGGEGDLATVEQWCSPETLSAIEAFVAKTLR